MSRAIAFAITDPAGGVAYYRGAAPANLARARGHTVVVSDAVQMTPLGALVVELELEAERPVAWQPEVIVLTGGWPSAIEPDWIDEARANGQTVIVDIDDWPWIPPDNYHHEPELAGAKFAAIERADACIVSTPYLANRLRQRVRVPVHVVRNVVDPTMFLAAAAVNGAHGDAYRDNVPVTIGYRGGLAWHRDDVATLAGVLEEVVRRAAVPVRFVHVGHLSRVTRTGAPPLEVPTFAEVAGIPDSLVYRRELVPFRDYGASLGRVDIGIVPLTARPFALAKSNIGALEWTAAAVPWLASPNPEYELLDAASIASRSRDWLAKLLGLVNHAGVRADVLERQRASAARWFATHSNAGDELELALDTLPVRETTPDASGAES